MKYSWLILIVLFLAGCKKDFTHLDTDVYGHAGLSLEKRKSEVYPNHFIDIQYALQQTSLNGTEVDVQMTKDGELVLFHDQLLDENSSLSGCIPEHTWEELQQGQFYKSSMPLTRLEDALFLLKFVKKNLFLDIKHSNSCTNGNIDFAQFDAALSNLLSVLNDEEKSRVIVNSRSLELLQTVSDTIVRKSLESDDPDFAIPAMQNNQISMLTIKLKAMNNSIKELIEQNGFQIGIYNVKTRKENETALKFAPDFVISDNIDCTLKSVNG